MNRPEQANSNRVVLITGSRKGIGRFLAEHLAAQAYTVVGCSRQASDLTLANYEHRIADVANEQEVVDLLRYLGKQYGRLDAVVNNAGIARMNPALLTPYAAANAIFQTNFLGTFLVCRESAKLMMKHRQGRIVNFSTVAVPLTLDGEAVYAASKSAVESFTRIFAKEVAPYGITVNAVGPGPVSTDLLRGVPEAKVRGLVDRLAIKRLATFEDIANVVEFFLRPESGYVTGQVLYLGGPG